MPKFEVTIDKTVIVEAEDKYEAFDLAVDEVSEWDCTIEEIEEKDVKPK